MTIHAKVAETFACHDARLTVVFQANATAVTLPARTCRIRWLGRIRRRSIAVARVLGAGISVDRDVGRLDLGNDISGAVTNADSAVSERLISLWQWRVESFRVYAARVGDARAVLAEIIRTRAVAGLRAADALARRVAVQSHAAIRIRWEIRDLRGAICAGIDGAWIAVVWRIAIVENGHRPARSIANDILAVAGFLERWACSRFFPCMLRQANMVDACALRALVFDDGHAMRGRGAFNARALAIADIGHCGDARRSVRGISSSAISIDTGGDRANKRRRWAIGVFCALTAAGTARATCAAAAARRGGSRERVGRVGIGDLGATGRAGHEHHDESICCKH